MPVVAAERRGALAKLNPALRGEQVMGIGRHERFHRGSFAAPEDCAS
jgi:hypothetical protein